MSTSSTVRTHICLREFNPQDNNDMYNIKTKDKNIPVKVLAHLIQAKRDWIVSGIMIDIGV